MRVQIDTVTWKSSLAISGKVEVPLQRDSRGVCVCLERAAYSANWLALGRQEREYNWG